MPNEPGRSFVLLKSVKTEAAPRMGSAFSRSIGMTPVGHRGSFSSRYADPRSVRDRRQRNSVHRFRSFHRDRAGRSLGSQWLHGVHTFTARWAPVTESRCGSNQRKLKSASVPLLTRWNSSQPNPLAAFFDRQQQENRP